jgi:hypothetical protein
MITAPNCIESFQRTFVVDEMTAAVHHCGTEKATVDAFAPGENTVGIHTENSENPRSTL